MNVLIFKTSVENKEDILRLSPYLDGVAGKGQWNFALDDCDRILRIVSSSLGPEDAIHLLKDFGYECEELEDIVPALV